jgi:hypothetical protein
MSESAGSRRASRKRRTIFNSRRSRSKAMRRVTLVLNILSVLVIIAGLWLLYDAFRARRELLAFYNHGQQIPTLIAQGNAAGASTAADAAAKNAASAHRHTSGPVWAIAARMPIVGDDIKAVRLVAASADSLGDQVLPTAIKAAQTVDPKKLAPVKGRVNVAPLAKLAPELERASAEAQKTNEEVQAIDPRGLLPMLRGPVVAAQNGFTKITGSAQGAYVTSKVMPWLFGKGSHRILVSFENNAEIRSLGGMPGSFGVLTVTNGKLSYEAQEGKDTFEPGGTVAFGKLDAEQKNIFSNKAVTYHQDTNMLPDVPQASRNLASAWELRQKPVDGVLSVDTVAMSHLMKALSPVSSHGFTVSGSNAVSMLLNEIYLKVPDTDLQNEIYSDVAAQAMKQITHNLKSPGGFASGLLQGLDESRVRLWVKNPEMQELLTTTRIGGDVSERSPKSPQYSLFLNNATASKLEYYLDYSASTTPVACNKKGEQQVTFTVDFKSTVPKNVTKLTPSVVGPHKHLPPGVISNSIVVMSPPGGNIGRMFINGKETDAYMTNLGTQRVLMTNLKLHPGESRTFTFEMYGAPGQINDSTVRITPGVRETGVGTLRPTGCY